MKILDRATQLKILSNYWFLISIVVILFLFTIMTSYFTGKLVASQPYNTTQNAYIEKNKQLERNLAVMTRQLSMMETTQEINSKAFAQVRETILLLEQQIYNQQKEIITYRSTVSKQKPKNTLVIKDIIIQETETPHTYRYKLFLTRYDQPKTLLKGTLQISLIGTLDSKVTTLSLAKLTNAPENESFAFQYMAMIPENNQFTTFVLPDDFSPKKIKITAYLPVNKQTETKEFSWLPQPIIAKISDDTEEPPITKSQGK